MDPYLRSRSLWERALPLVPGGTHTISKRVTTFLDPDHFPAFAASGHGARLTDVDGRTYLDYISALGAVLLGYAVERIDQRVARQLSSGFLFSLPHSSEVELAEKLVAVIPSAEQVRFFKSGAEATSAAVRTARLATGREVILCCGYHGWHDWWAVARTPQGIPAHQRGLLVEFPFNDLGGLELAVAAHGAETAAIILTPAAYGMNPHPGFLEGVRAVATRLGVPLVFDEIITGFRWALGGAQQKYGVTPDLTCIGKAMANGMPLTALVGSAALMEPMKDNWISSTYASDALAIGAALETIAILEETSVLAQLADQGARLNAEIAAVATARGVTVAMGDAAPAIRFDFAVAPPEQPRMVRDFVAGCARRGVLVRRDQSGVSLCLMGCLTEADLALTLEVFDQVFHEIT